MKNWYQHVFVPATVAGKKLRVVGALIVSMLTVMFVLTAVVAASSPDATVIYYACVTNTTSAIKIVSSTTTCPTGTHKIHWNQQGPIGPTGPQGPQGPQGPSGVSQGYLGYTTTASSLGSGSFTPVVSTNPVAGGNYI